MVERTCFVGNRMARKNECTRVCVLRKSAATVRRYDAFRDEPILARPGDELRDPIEGGGDGLVEDAAAERRQLRPLRREMGANSPSLS